MKKCEIPNPDKWTQKGHRSRLPTLLQQSSEVRKFTQPSNSLLRVPLKGWNGFERRADTSQGTSKKKNVAMSNLVPLSGSKGRGHSVPGDGEGNGLVPWHLGELEGRPFCHCFEGSGGIKRKGITGQEVNGSQPYRWPQFSVCWVWNDSFCFYHSKSKVSAFSFNVKLLPSKACWRAVSEGMLLETGFGNFILVSCHSVWGWAHVCVVFLFFWCNWYLWIFWHNKH